MRQTGAEVATYRAGFPPEVFETFRPDFVLISPGPGRPEDFGVPGLVQDCVRRGMPVFGVCLGLQGWWRPSAASWACCPTRCTASLRGSATTAAGVRRLPQDIKVGRYHSLYAIREKLPPELEITAESDDGVIMGVRHRRLPVEAVQFHPESLLSQDEGHGLKMIENVVRMFRAVAGRKSAGAGVKSG